MNDRTSIGGWIMVILAIYAVMVWLTKPDCSHLIAGSPAHDECEAGR